MNQNNSPGVRRDQAPTAYDGVYQLIEQHHGRLSAWIVGLCALIPVALGGYLRGRRLPAVTAIEMPILSFEWAWTNRASQNERPLWLGSNQLRLWFSAFAHSITALYLSAHSFIEQDLIRAQVQIH